MRIKAIRINSTEYLHRLLRQQSLGLLLVLAQHITHELLGQVAAVGIDVRGPGDGAGVVEGDPHGQAHGQVHPAGEGRQVLDDVALAVLGVGQRLEAVDHPGEHAAQERAVQQVDGKRVLAEPQEGAVAEDVAHLGREVQANGHELDAEAAGEARVVGVGGQDGGQHIVQLVGPADALGVGFGVRGNKGAQDQEKGRQDTGETRTLGEPLGGGGVLLEVGQEDAKEELHAHGRVVGEHKVQPHAHGGHHAVAGTNKAGGEQEDINPETADEQGQHGPLVCVVLVAAGGPSRNDVINETADAAPELGDGLGAGLADPPGVAVGGDVVGAEFAGEPGEESGKGGGQDETGDAAQGGLAHGAEGGVVLALAVELDGLEGADVAGDHGEDGDTDAALEEDADEGVLDETGECLVVVCAVEEQQIKGAAQMGEHDERRREAAEAVDPFDVAFCTDGHCEGCDSPVESDRPSEWVADEM